MNSQGRKMIRPGRSRSEKPPGRTDLSKQFLGFLGFLSSVHCIQVTDQDSESFCHRRNRLVNTDQMVFSDAQAFSPKSLAQFKAESRLKALVITDTEFLDTLWNWGSATDLILKEIQNVTVFVVSELSPYLLELGRDIYNLRETTKQNKNPGL